MRRSVLILDDTPARVEHMRMVLAELLPRHEIVSFENAQDSIAWLPRGLGWTELICLDHDLGPNRTRDGKVFDPGTGRDVADALAGFPAVGPVIVHSTNAQAVPGMLLTLRDAGWPCSAVVPHDDVAWVTSDWRDRVRQLIASGRVNP